MKKIKNTKGFTLMEMLIVVAIIAILIAIAIPTFNSSLNKAKVGTDEANIRSGYASVMTEVLTSDTGVTTGTTYTLNVDASVTKTGDTGGTPYVTKGDANKVVTGDDAKISIGGVDVKPWSAGQKVTYSVTVKDGETTIAINTEDSK